MVTRPIGVAAEPYAVSSFKRISVDPGKLIRVSRHTTNEPYFGNSRRNRFDDPLGQYGTCYFGMSLAVAVAETLLHDRVPKRGVFPVPAIEITSRFVIEFKGRPLNIAMLKGSELKRLGGHAGLSGTSYYKTPQAWSSVIYNHRDQVDGFLYMSRHKDDEEAIVLFDRAAHKVKMTRAIPLAAHPDFGQVATDFNIRGI
jgi:hypothetical protein